MRLSTRPAALAAGLTATALALTACGSTSSSGSAAGTARAAAGTSGITLEVGDQAGTGAQTLLQASGLLGKLPFKVTFADFTSGPPMLQALSSGHLDIGGVGDAPPVFAAAGGAKLKIVGALANGDNDAALLVSRKSGITSIQELKGKKIAVAEGSSGDYHLLTVLAHAGLSTQDVTLVNLQPSQALAALQSGQIDGWDIGSPYPEEAEAAGARVLVNGHGYGAPYSYEVASDSALANPGKVAAIQTYLKLLNRAHRWANAHPDQWAAIWAKATGLPIGVMRRAARDDIETPTAVNGKIVASEQALVDAFSAAGQIPDRFSFAPYVSDAFSGAV